MDSIRIKGGVPLNGTVEISGAKNAALPLMAASLLTSEEVTLSHIPYLADVTTMANLLVHLGAELCIDGDPDVYRPSGRVIKLHAASIKEPFAPYDIVRKMRASALVLGPLLARCGRADVSLPGGCAIGTRPMDMHLGALEQMGAKISLEDGYIHATAEDGLKGAEITFQKVSVGATENIVMAACLAEGTTVIHNAAREPEITDLIHFLQKMGAKITGEGTEHLFIEGVSTLHGTEYSVLPDRIEAGTYAIAAAITGGEITLRHIDPEIMGATLDALKHIGVTVDIHPDSITVSGSPETTRAADMVTEVYPGFATDMQAQMMALLCLAKGNSSMIETIFENRFMHVPELQRMGADIEISGNKALIRGVESLRPAAVMATDLRASVSLVLAALAAKGESTINRIYHIDRGYERLEEKLIHCGADIVRIRH